MNFALLTQALVFLALIFAVFAFGRKIRVFSRLSRPVDRAKPKGSLQKGLIYAYTLGMAPWSKESTRIHAIAYMRGVAFHMGIFLGLALLVASPWLGGTPQIIRNLFGWMIATGALFGLVGFVARFVDHNLKALSNSDDYFAALIVTLFLGAEAFWLFYPPAQAIFYLISAVMLVYTPLGKIRHCIYFAYSRLFYGKFFGSRAVLPHVQQSLR